jgi:hypothetical protein
MRQASHYKSLVYVSAWDRQAKSNLPTSLAALAPTRHGLSRGSDGPIDHLGPARETESMACATRLGDRHELGDVARPTSDTLQGFPRDSFLGKNRLEWSQIGFGRQPADSAIHSMPFHHLLSRSSKPLPGSVRQSLTYQLKAAHGPIGRSILLARCRPLSAGYPEWHAQQEIGHSG